MDKQTTFRDPYEFLSKLPDVGAPCSINFPSSHYEKGSRFLFHASDLRRSDDHFSISGHYQDTARGKYRRTPQLTDFTFPFCQPDELVRLIGAAQVPSSHLNVHGAELSIDAFSSWEEYSREFVDRRKRDMEHAIADYLEDPSAYEERMFTHACSRLGPEWVLDIPINNNNLIRHSRISMYAIGNGTVEDPGELIGLFTAFYSKDKGKHIDHLERMIQSFAPEGRYVLPLGGSYLTVIQGVERDGMLNTYPFVAAVTGERSRYLGWIAEMVREPLIAKITAEVFENVKPKYQKADIKMVTAFPG